jgi:hypothetical protein
MSLDLTDLEDKIDGIIVGGPSVYPTYRIFEATDDAEYSALSAANKSIYGLILSCGSVDLSAGTSVREKLMAMFGAGTTTRANLAELVS